MSYTSDVMDLVVKRNPAEPEFHQAVKEVLAGADEKFIMQRSDDGKPVEFRILMNRDPNVKKQKAEDEQENK